MLTMLLSQNIQCNYFCQGHNYTVKLCTEFLILKLTTHTLPIIVLKQWPPSRQLNSLSPERKCLFNDALNTFYLRLCCVRYMVKDHSDSKRENLLLSLLGILFLISSMVYVHHPTDRIAYTMGSIIPVMEHWLE